MPSTSSRSKPLLLAAVVIFGLGLIATFADTPAPGWDSLVTLFVAGCLFAGMLLFGAALLFGRSPADSREQLGPITAAAPDAGPYRSSGAVVPSVRGPRQRRVSWARLGRYARTGQRLTLCSGFGAIVWVALCSVSSPTYDLLLIPIVVVGTGTVVSVLAGLGCLGVAALARAQRGVETSMNG
jgi:hypothetical protein